jgi:integrase
VPLKTARERRNDARKLIENGIDPSAQRKAQKIAQSGSESFETIAREWHTQNRDKWSEVTATRTLERIAADLFPYIGARPVGEITAPELLACLRRTEARGAVETAHRLRQYCEKIFGYAIATGRAQSNPGAAIRGTLKSMGKEKHYAAITDPRKVGELLRAIEGYSGDALTRAALKLAPLLFVRPGELRHAEWTEIDLDAARWEIPAHKMKMRQAHVVPLSTQAVAILHELQPLTGHGRYVFPSLRSADRCMSENTLGAALRRLGYTGEEMTAHGFRSIATTLLNEQGWHRDAIERQMAHGERDKVRAAYNRAEHLPERVRMMQAWADYLDGLRSGADVVLFRRAT